LTIRSTKVGGLQVLHLRTLADLPRELGARKRQEANVDIDIRGSPAGFNTGNGNQTVSYTPLDSVSTTKVNVLIIHSDPRYRSLALYLMFPLYLIRFALVIASSWQRSEKCGVRSLVRLCRPYLVPNIFLMADLLFLGNGEIESQLQRDRLMANKDIKILLLEAGESDKVSSSILLDVLLF